MSAPKRAKEWAEFSKATFEHVVYYTIPQYGDEGEDRFTEMDVEGVNQDLKKYMHRLGKGQRGTEEQLRDYLKIAHAACVAWHKLWKVIDHDTQKET